MKIGICDYGIGGLGLYKLLREQTSVDIIYFSDTGYIPYGKVREYDLKIRLNKVLNFLKTQDAEFVAVACNSASTVLPIENHKAFGIIDYGIQMVEEISPTEIAIVGGNRTIDSEIYKNAFEKIGIKVVQKSAQILSIRIEAGDVNSIEIENDIKNIFSEFQDQKFILLACTHYPVVSKLISTYCPNSILLDPCKKMSESIIEKLNNCTGNNNDIWITTGNALKMRQAARSAYDIELSTIEIVTL